MLSPIVDEIAGEREDIKVAKINVDEQQELAAAFQVMSIPTLVVMKDGKIVSKTMGVRPKKTGTFSAAVNRRKKLVLRKGL